MSLILPDGSGGTPIPTQNLELHPYGALVLVEKIVESDRTAGGIVLPEDSQAAVKLPRWTVLEVGPGLPLQNGEIHRPYVKPGDVLVLAPNEMNRGQRINVSMPGEKLRQLVDEGSILALVGDA